MDAYRFLTQHGVAEATRVAEAAGTNYAYFSQIAYQHRRPSPEKAKALALASDGRMDVLELLYPPPLPDEAIAARLNRVDRQFVG